MPPKEKSPLEKEAQSLWVKLQSMKREEQIVQGPGLLEKIEGLKKRIAAGEKGDEPKKVEVAKPVEPPKLIKFAVAGADGNAIEGKFVEAVDIATAQELVGEDEVAIAAVAQG